MWLWAEVDKVRRYRLETPRFLRVCIESWDATLTVPFTAP